MITAIIDTNIMVRALIAGHPHSASRFIFRELFARRFTLVQSVETIAEIARVLSEPNVRSKHHWDDEQLRQLVQEIEAISLFYKPTATLSPVLTRDPTDLKWLELAMTAMPDYLVTRDMRHLGRLKAIGPTKIVSPGAFAKALGAEK